MHFARDPWHRAFKVGSRVGSAWPLASVVLKTDEHCHKMCDEDLARDNVVVFLGLSLKSKFTHPLECIRIEVISTIIRICMSGPTEMKKIYTHSFHVIPGLE